MESHDRTTRSERGNRSAMPCSGRAFANANARPAPSDDRHQNGWEARHAKVVSEMPCDAAGIRRRKAFPRQSPLLLPDPRLLSDLAAQVVELRPADIALHHPLDA